MNLFLTAILYASVLAQPPLGEVWIPVAPGHPLPAGHVSKPVAAFGKLWTLTWGSKTLWVSIDGENWEPTDYPFESTSNLEPMQLMYSEGTLCGVKETYKGGEGSYTTTDGVTWQKYGIPGGVNRNHALYFGFQGNFYRLGGAIFNGAPGLWESTDGATWEVREGHPSLITRSDAAITELAGRLFIAGGSSDDGWLPDVYSSMDAKTWTLETDSAPWLSREGHELESYQNKLWLLMGYDREYQNPIDYLDDVWSSNDGKTWTRSIHAEPRLLRSSHAAYVFNDRLYITGGVSKYSSLDDTWYTEDGEHWTQANSAVPWEYRSNFAAASFKGHIYMTGGKDAKKTYHDMWRSRDGRQWELLTKQCPWPTYPNNEMVAHGDFLYMLCGGDGTPYGTVWRSPDGIAWSLVLGDTPWSLYEGSAVVSHAGKIWVISGGSGTGENSWIWCSSNGIEWERIVAEESWSKRWGFALASHQGRLWIMGGNGGYQSYLDDVWSSEDGVHWTLEAQDAFIPHAYSRAVSAGGRLWMAGGELRNPNYCPEGEGFGEGETEGGGCSVSPDIKDSSKVYSSVDGKNWVLASESFGRPMHGHKFIVHDGSMFLLGGQYKFRRYDDWYGTYSEDTYYVHQVAMSEGPRETHAADIDRDDAISFSELLRGIQLYNSGAIHCEVGTEDGFAPGPGDQGCTPHATDYAPQDWAISLSELLRLVQFYNTPSGYATCEGSEDGFCPVG